MKKSRPVSPCQLRAGWGCVACGWWRTYDEAFHLVFAYDFDAQCFPDLVVKLESTPSRGHDTEVVRGGTIEAAVVGLQLAHELDARVYPVGLELEEVQAAADGALVGLAGEVDELGERASDLHSRISEGGFVGRAGWLASTATWLTSWVWLGRRMSLGSCS